MNRRPTALKVLEGNPGKRPLSEHEPQPRAVEPRLPKELDAESRRAWKRLSKQLVKLGLLTESDGDVFGDICRTRALIIRCRKFIEKNNKSLMAEEYWVDGAGQEHTKVSISSYVKLELQLMEMFRRQANEFGLTPRGRSGLAVDKGKKKGGLEALID